MNFANIDREMAPRTQRLMRELAGPEFENDPDVRYWWRISAMVRAAAAALFVALVAIAGAYVPPAGGPPASPAQTVTGPADPDVL